MSIEPYYMLKLLRAERQLRDEIARAQIQHPIAEYDEARVERLVEQMQAAQRGTQPQEVTFNV